MPNFALSIHTETSEGREGARRSELPRGPRALEGSRGGRARSLKDGVIRTVVVVTRTAGPERGGITGFGNRRLTYSETPLISLKTNHLESKEYIVYLCHRNTLSGQKLGQCLCLAGFAAAPRDAAASPPCLVGSSERRSLPGWPFGI